jgi:hypothetical protein
MTIRHLVANQKDTANYIAALGQVSTRMDEAIAESRRLRILSWRSSRRRWKPRKSPRPAAPRLSPKPKRSWQRKSSRLEPRDCVARIATSRSKDDAGLWRLRGGPEAHAHLLRRYTTNLTADQIHEIGLNEVARIEGEIDAILTKLGRTPRFREANAAANHNSPAGRFTSRRLSNPAAAGSHDEVRPSQPGLSRMRMGFPFAFTIPTRVRIHLLVPVPALFMINPILRDVRTGNC